MTQVQQWLAEIKGLQQKLAEVQQEREQAYASAANWCHLYEVESKQRRAEAEAFQATIELLQAELSSYQATDPMAENYGAIVQQQVERWQSTEELKLQLMQVLMERDQLLQSLEAERQAHHQTRQDLTTALGDTMDQLTKARSDRARPAPASSEPAIVIPITAAAGHPSITHSGAVTHSSMATGHHQSADPDV
ncbi:MAG: hypothetical protein MUF72_05310 [Elainella sp. Prado103]|jgi:hypothetical protein|nr:hypothetical protein [Elainella sp. Prado103]